MPKHRMTWCRALAVMRFLLRVGGAANFGPAWPLRRERGGCSGGAAAHFDQVPDTLDPRRLVRQLLGGSPRLGAFDPAPERDPAPLGIHLQAHAPEAGIGG